MRQRWTGKVPQPKLDALPKTMPPGVVQRLASGGPFGWLIDAPRHPTHRPRAPPARAAHPKSGPEHYRIWDDGTREQLPNEWTAYSVPADASPEEVEAIKQRYYEHNREVQQLLQQRGFLPPASVRR